MQFLIDKHRSGLTIQEKYLILEEQKKEKQERIERNERERKYREILAALGKPLP